jgi:hypothetical protein
LTPFGDYGRVVAGPVLQEEDIKEWNDFNEPPPYRYKVQYGSVADMPAEHHWFLYRDLKLPKK